MKIESSESRMIKDKESKDSLDTPLNYNKSSHTNYELLHQDKREFILSQLDPELRRNEFRRYFRLFGYNPDKTILQVHIVGFFNKGKLDPKEKERRKSSIERYGATTFMVVGRTHDPSILNNVIQPKKQNPYQRSPGYVGYLWKVKDKQNRPPHEVIPLDFTPLNIPYPNEWKKLFATKGFMIALHVPSRLAKVKNNITRLLYRIGKKPGIDVRKEWSFLDDIESEMEKISEKMTNSKK